MKTEENNITHMTKFDDVKKKIETLAKEDNCDKLKEGMKKLHKFIKTYTIKKAKRESYIDFYEVLGYDSKRNEIIGERLGQISLQDYKQHKKEIERLRKESNSEELKQFLK